MFSKYIILFLPSTKILPYSRLYFSGHTTFIVEYIALIQIQKQK